MTSIRANAWFGRSLTTDANAGEIFSHLSVLAEISACIIPTANRFYWQDGDWRTAVRGFLLMAVALTVVFFAASGFVLNTISSGVEARGDRMTPAVELAQRTADTLANPGRMSAASAAIDAGTWKRKSARPWLTSLPLVPKFGPMRTRRRWPARRFQHRAHCPGRRFGRHVPVRGLPHFVWCGADLASQLTSEIPA